jgi:hypothetical protein
MMGADIVLVRAQGWPAERPERLEPGAKHPAVLIHAPNAPPVRVALHHAAAESATPSGYRPHLPVAFDDEHLLAGPTETRSAWLSTADVIVRHRTGQGPIEWSLQSVFARFPGCVVAAIINGDSCVVGTAIGWQTQLIPLNEVGNRGADEAACVFASAVHTWLVAHRSLAALHGAHLQFVMPGGVNPGWRHEVQVVACTLREASGSVA